jgi:superfamily II DNA or RNA helicase
VSDDVGAHARIDRFARGGADAPRWLVAVNMVSEGVDVPRLVLAAYATVKRTDLFFRQAVGRVVRRRADDPGDLVATVFLPADATLKACAERVEVELRQQVSDDVGAFDAERPLGVARRADFQPLDAEVEPGGMILAGRTTGVRRSTRQGGSCASSASPSARFAPCSSSCAASASAPRPRPSRRCRLTGGSKPSAARSTGLPAGGPSCGARSTLDTHGRKAKRASTAPWA